MYALCTVAELLDEHRRAVGRETPSAAAHVSGSAPQVAPTAWIACLTDDVDRAVVAAAARSLSASPSQSGAPQLLAGAYRFNARGRLLLRTTNGREVLVLVRPDVAPEATPETLATANTFAALDRNCYHVGYPLDMGQLQRVTVAAGGGGLPDIEEAGSERWCLNCPLHNRIFDLTTGHMVAYQVDAANDAGGGAGAARPPVVSRGCHQRTHRIAVADGRVFIMDSFAESGLVEHVTVAAGCTGLGVQELMQTLSTRPGFVPSDKYNLLDGETQPTPALAAKTARSE